MQNFNVPQLFLTESWFESAFSGDDDDDYDDDHECEGYYTYNWEEWRDHCPDGYTDCGGFCDFDDDCYGDDWCSIYGGQDNEDCRLDCGEAPQEGCWDDWSCWDSSDGASPL